VISACCLYEHHDIAAVEFLSLVRDALSSETVILAFLAIAHLPMQVLVSIRARLLQLTRLFGRARASSLRCH
jgi:hypothetical protein